MYDEIVTREEAKAARLMISSGERLSNGVPEFRVIDYGNLVGFVMVNPYWQGINRQMLEEVSRIMYDDQEALERDMRLFNGIEVPNITPLQTYQLPPDAISMTPSMPAMTLTSRQITFNNACHKRLQSEWVQILYHPLRNMIILREGFKDDKNSFRWEEDGKTVKAFAASALLEAIYEGLQWDRNYAFKCRGLYREKGEKKALIFFMDQPRIAVSKEEIKRLEKEHPEYRVNGDWYIPYRTNRAEIDRSYYNVEKKRRYVHPRKKLAETAYPQEWAKGFSWQQYYTSELQMELMDKITEEDLRTQGAVYVNPMVGEVASMEDIRREMEAILNEITAAEC